MKKEIEHIWIDLHEELYGFIFNKVKDEQIAKDIFQEVFLKVQLKIDQLQHTSKLTSWVYQIARNTIIDHYRNFSLKNASIEAIDIPENEKNDFEYSKLSNCINQKIDHLSAKHKEAIVLTSFKSYSQKELAAHLKISYSGAKSRIQKAKSILKDHILNCPNVESDTSGKLIDYDTKNS